MRHFDFLSADDRDRLFLHPPQEFGLDDPPSVLAVALGATLYIPATRPHLAESIAKRAAQGVLSAVVCLEDAIADADLPAAERNAVAQLRSYARTDAPKPLVFVRVRAAEQIPMVVAELGEQVGVLAGFVLPKFTEASGLAYLEAVTAAGESAGRRMLAMPVLETREISYAEQRLNELLAVRELLEKYRPNVLAVRLGATDLSATYGLRRPRELTIYDVRLVADVISDVVNVLARADGSGWVVTGPVWEYFSGTERLFKPQLRESPFIEHEERSLRAELIARDLDGLIREVLLDRANGLLGKTVIHPTHVAAVHALSVVTHEEFSDATDVLGTQAGGGVAASSYRNKMNESKPHSAWARRIMQRAHAFGVAHESTSFVDLLGAGLHQ
ncbi:HpcH/HpaI aldolase/citrate lyase family protein [Jatrophihabitans telluris]|uniref:HpcH/HpaI aldolase/citrate lyase family protein n=1 Tax=Jatrophihabitans telluris TaxID=2038343 RepID=A0ABY4R4K2_9ACTN|nr:HpcH/HpaI aldolase/citrate lyase family protein [Jatrophihabitans telluris]UQX90262.1 HpcH/HpaI aldolase/citrate lyase family protein [Jatrophihabitans telluris]